MINSRGVTLIELLIVTAIMFILLGASFVGYRQRGQELALQRAGFKVMTDIERVREMAMSAQETSGQVPEGGYGVYFDSSASDKDKYRLFADLDSDRFRKPDETEDFETILLEEGIEIETVSPSDSLDVVFLPPSPDVYIEGLSPSPVNAEITIRLKSDHSKTKTITVNSAGLISISN